MSGLGEGMTQGETGTVTTSAPLPDQIPSQPATIAANTAIETVDELLHRNWVYKTTLTIDPSMKPGHVFGYLPVHPSGSHMYVQHVAKMFKTWTGGMLVRSRFMANFANGGSFRVGFLPPSYSEAEVAQGLPLATMTAYPNIDLDPKNTAWSHFSGEDERNTLFHWMVEKPAKTEDFGGWIVFYVVGSLVSTMQAQGQVALVVETAGNFVFSQPANIASGPTPPTPQGPLLASAQLISDQALSDGSIAPGTTGVSVLAKSVANVQAGAFGAWTIGGKDPAEFQGSVANAVYLELRRSFLERGVTLMLSQGARPTETSPFITSDQAVYQLNPAVSLGFDYVQSVSNTGQLVKYDLIDAQYTKNGQGSILWKLGKNTGEGEVYSATIQSAPRNVPVSPIPVNGCTIPKMPPSESIVLFSDYQFGVYAMQTAEIAADCKKATTPDPNTSFVYNLREEGSSGVLLQMRLCPNGMFTTTGLDTAALVKFNAGSRYILEFLTELPITTPLPGNATNLRSLARLHRARKLQESGMPAQLAQAYY